MPGGPPPGTTTTTAPAAVSPRGGPQPAAARKKQRQSYSSLGDMVKQVVASAAFAGAPKGSYDQVKAALDASVPRPAQAEMGAPPPFVAPTLDELKQYLQSRNLQVDTNISASDPMGGMGMALGGAMGDGGTVGMTDAQLRSILSGANSPSDLATALGVTSKEIDPLLQSVFQRSQQNARLDQALAEGKAQIASASAPPSHGGTTADSIERNANGPGAADINPLDLATAAPMTAADYQTLVAQLHAADANAGPAKLEAMKQRVLQDAAVAQQRADRINAAYEAGLKGAPLPAMPQPGESTAQGSYGVAGAQRASTFTPTHVERNLDPRAAEDALLVAAGLVQQKRQEEDQWQAMQVLTDQAQAAAAAQKEVDTAAASTRKKADKEQQKAAERALAARVQQNWAQERADQVVAAVDRKGFTKDGTSVSGLDATTGKDLLSTLVARFRAGEREQSVIESVFGGLTSAELNVPTLNLVQIAKVLAGGEVPPELRSGANGYDARLSAAMAYAAEHPEAALK